MWSSRKIDLSGRDMRWIERIGPPTGFIRPLFRGVGASSAFYCFRTCEKSACEETCLLAEENPTTTAETRCAKREIPRGED